MMFEKEKLRVIASACRLKIGELLQSDTAMAWQPTFPKCVNRQGQKLEDFSDIEY